MKLSASLDIVGQMWMAVQLGLPPILSALYASPALLFSPSALSRISMDAIWAQFGQGGDGNAREEKGALITPHARGVVLDIGAGHGYTAAYLDHVKVTHYIALEPNMHMHAAIRTKAHAAGFTEDNGTLVILACGAEDTATIISALPARAQVDTIVSALTLCTVPAPQATLLTLVQKALAHGGEFLFYEHVLSHRTDVAWWQRFWTPIWKRFFDGCCLDRPTHVWIKELMDEESGESVWKEGSIWDANWPEEHLFWRQMGRFVKN